MTFSIVGMQVVVLFQAHGTEEMKTQVGEEEEDDMKEPQEDEENGEEHEQSAKIV